MSILILQKVKELTYMHSEGIMAGELKHGPLALVDEQMPVLMIVLRDPVYKKCINALLQVKARNCTPILICEEGDEETKQLSQKNLEVPRTVDCLQVNRNFSVFSHHNIPLNQKNIALNISLNIALNIALN